jgi:hypothetical protein
MPTNPELTAIEDEVQRRFQPSNPITQAIATKLAQTLYQQRRCEYLIDFARSIPTHKLDEMPAERQTAFRQNVRKLLEKIKTLKRSSGEYSSALSAKTGPSLQNSNNFN